LTGRRNAHKHLCDRRQTHEKEGLAIGEARTALKREGYVLALGELKNSYRAVKRVR